MSIGSAQNIYNHAVEKSGVRRKGGIHVLRHYPGFRTIQRKLEVSAPNSLFTGLGAASVCRLTRHSPHPRLEVLEKHQQFVAGLMTTRGFCVDRRTNRPRMGASSAAASVRSSKK
jgi:hypothetical protein